ncbi:MAG: hypothetical protein JRH11_03125 [Deltaproteobacteria bacterium]|nr:hypothetical protein [Deltaproteobacteria bacterium]
MACSDDTSSPTDSGPGDSGASDTAVGDTGMSDTAVGDSGGDPEVVRCEAASAAFAAVCTDDGGRTCNAMVLGTHCQSDARPGNLADAIDCLRENSSASSCRSFPDPSAAETCVAAAYAGVTSSEVDAAVAAITAHCEFMTSPLEAAVPLYSLTSAELAAVQACADGAADCDAYMDCIALDPFAALSACF